MTKKSQEEWVRQNRRLRGERTKVLSCEAVWRLRCRKEKLTQMAWRKKCWGREGG